jgi:ribose transport system permease protein
MSSVSKKPDQGWWWGGDNGGLDPSSGAAHPTVWMMKGIRLSQEGVVFAISILMFIAFSLSLRGFITPANILSLIRSVSILGMLGLGMALVVLGRGIDLALIATMVISAAWAMALEHSGYPLWLALTIGAVFVVIAEVLIGVIIAYAEIPAIFTTLAMGSVIYGVGRSYFFAIDMQTAPYNAHSFIFLGSGVLFGIPMPVIVFAILAVLLHFVLRYTKFGRLIYAMGDNPRAATIAGAPIRFLTISQYVVSGLIAYLAGLVMTASVLEMNTRIYNSTMLYDVILIVVLGGVGLAGGRGGVRNVLVGTALVGIMLNGMTIMNISYIEQNLVKSLVLLSAIIIDTLINPRDEQTSQQGDI